MVDVVTRSFGNTREGAQLAERTLTAIPVQKRGIRKLFEVQLPGDARGTEGQPLIVAGLRMRDGLVHTVMFVCSMSNDVRAFDADTGLLLWQQRIGNPITNTKRMDMWFRQPPQTPTRQINDHWGILGTPVINTGTGTLYCVCMSSPDDNFNDSHFYLHALSLIDGRDQVQPLDLNAATYKAPGLDRVARLGEVARKQRCGLLFGSRNGVDTVFVANGSFVESAATNQGWMIAVDVTGILQRRSMILSASWCTTMRYSGGGIWMGGQGPSMDADGHVFGMTGNGAFDGRTDFGESIFKLRYMPPVTGAAGRIEIIDWFTPFTDSGRVGLDPTIASIGAEDDADETATNMNDAGDQDLNSGGPLILPIDATGFSIPLALGAGKDGILYVTNSDHMGRPTLGQFAPDRMEEVYAMLACPPYGFTYYPGGVDLSPRDTGTIPTTYGGYTHHQHSTPVYYRSPRFGSMLFTCGENGPVRAFRLREPEPGRIAIDYLGQGAEIASAGMRPPGGMPGGMLTLSADGDAPDTAILWCLMPLNGDANRDIAAGRLILYGADWIDNGRLVKLWDSQDWAVDFAHCKFNVVSIANGRAYVPTYDGRIIAFCRGDL